jgi:type IV secretory pathway VirB6-like protein
MKTNIQIFLLMTFLSIFSASVLAEDGLNQSAWWQYQQVLTEKVDEACGRGWGSSATLNIGLDEDKEKSEPCLQAKNEQQDYSDQLSQNGNTSQGTTEYASKKLNEHNAEQEKLMEIESFIKVSIGKYVFGTFFNGLRKWVFGTNNQKGKFQVFAETLKPYLEKAMVLMITIFGLFSFFGKYQEYGVKVLQALISFVVVLAFLEWDTFNYWIFDPLLGLLIGTMKVLFDSHDTGLVETIFGVDQHFDALFVSIERYTTLLAEKGAWFEVQMFKQLVAYLIIGLFGALYAIFTILIIVGFFGFMLLLGFAPIFMAIGIFNKGLFFAWLKATMNYFLIPIFTAAVMSVTIVFLSQAAEAIGRLSPSDSIFIRDVGFVFLVGIFSVGLHWKAPEFAAAISGGMASGAGSIVGTAASVGAAAWGLSKTPLGGGRNLTNSISGATGSGMFGNQNTKSYQAGNVANAAWERFRTGGIQ